LSLPRQFRATEEDYEEHGCSRGCPGREALLSSATKQKHSEARRRRMSEAMAMCGRAQDAKERKIKCIRELLEGRG
jgi:hypothetical protein